VETIPVTEPFSPDPVEHQRAIRGIARALCRSDADADDVAQDLAVAVHTRSGEAPRDWLPWLAGAARRIHWARGRSDARRRVRENEVARAEEQPGAEEPLIQQEMTARLLALIETLPDAQSEVMHLRFWEGLPPRAIAVRVDASVAAVKTRQKRALAALREKLTDETEGGREAWMSALGGLPLVSIPAQAPVIGVAGAKSLLSLGAWMSLKSLAVVAVLVAVGTGIWWSAQEASPDLEEPALELAQVAPSSTPVGPAAVEVAPERTMPARAAIPVAQPAAAQPQAPPDAPEGILLVTGRVLNVPAGGDVSKATAASGIKVQMQAFAMMGFNESEVPQSVTDETGAFRIEHDAAQHYPSFTILAGAGDGYAAASTEVRWEKGDLAPVTVDLHRQAFTALSGEVVDRVGAPLAGVKVALKVGFDPSPGTVEVTSNAEGRFRFDQCTESGYAAATLPGWTMLASPAFEKDETGGWLPVRVVMCPSGALGVRIVSRDGGPISGLRVDLDMPPNEAYGSKRHSGWTAFQARADATTDASGVAWFRDVWSDSNLRVQAHFDGSFLRMEREKDDVLEPLGLGAVGLPIVVSPGTERVLTLELESASTLRCKVVDASGAAYPGATVRLLNDGHHYSEQGFMGFNGKTDDQGRCAIRLVSSVPLGAAVLSASDDHGMRFSWSPGESPLAASTKLDLGDPPSEEIVLTLAPTLGISGLIVDPDGEPVRGKVSAKPVDGELVAGRLATGMSPVTSVGKSGEFNLAGMPDGLYDLAVECGGFARVDLKGVQAGTHGLTVELTEPRAARVEVFIDTGGAAMKQYVTLVGTHTPASGIEVEVPELARREVFTQPLGWPAEMQGLWYGAGGRRNGDGHTFFSLTPSEQPSKLRELDPGTYWIGAQARAEDGTQFAQMGTGLVRVEEGDYHVTLRMRACVALSGQVRGESLPKGLGVSICLADGRPLPLNVSREKMATFLGLSALGDFQLECVPAGSYELRLGTRAELRAGGALATQPLELEAGTPAVVTFEL
jgi:RNA polymerase sigma-70 factor (ECF subfamily)